MVAFGKRRRSRQMIGRHLNGRLPTAVFTQPKIARGRKVRAKVKGKARARRVRRERAPHVKKDTNRSRFAIRLRLAPMAATNAITETVFLTYT